MNPPQRLTSIFHLTEFSADVANCTIFHCSSSWDQLTPSVQYVVRWRLHNDANAADALDTDGSRRAASTRRDHRDQSGEWLPRDYVWVMPSPLAECTLRACRVAQSRGYNANIYLCVNQTGNTSVGCTSWQAHSPNLVFSKGIGLDPSVGTLPATTSSTTRYRQWVPFFTHSTSDLARLICMWNVHPTPLVFLPLVLLRLRIDVD